jgi:hypothetical protein
LRAMIKTIYTSLIIFGTIGFFLYWGLTHAYPS